MIKYIVIALVAYGFAAVRYEQHACQKLQAFNSQDEQGVMMGHAYNAERTKEAKKSPGLVDDDAEFIDRILRPTQPMQPTGQPVPRR